MRRLWIGAMVLTAAVVVPRSASAQAEAGDKEILTFANVVSVIGSGFSSTSGNVFFNVGQFISDRMEVGGGPSITISRSSFDTGFGSGSSTETDFGVGVNGFVRYYFGEASATLKPYAGGELVVNKLNVGDDESFADQVFASGSAGVKNYLTENAAIDFKGSFGVNPSNPGELQLFLFTVGLTYIF